MLAQMLFDIKAIIKDKVYYAIALLFALLMLLPLLEPPGIHPEYGAFSPDSYKANYDILLHGLTSGAYNGAPPEVMDSVHEEMRIYQAILADGSDEGGEERLKAMVELEELQLQDVLNGSLVGNPPDFYQGRIALLNEQRVTGNYVIYESAQGMPALNYLAWQLNQNPYSYLFFPAIVILSSLFSSVNRTKSYLFEAGLPCSRILVSCSHLLVGTLAAFAAVAVAMLPAFVIASLNNGIGSLSYPVVDILSQGLTITNLAGYFAQLSSLVVCGSLLLGTLMLLLSRFVDNRMVLVVCGILLVLVPSYPAYFDANGSFSSILHLLPTTYFSYINIIGTTSPFFLADQTANSDISFATGTAVFLVSTAVVLALSHLAGVMKQKILKA